MVQAKIEERGNLRCWFIVVLALAGQVRRTMTSVLTAMVMVVMMMMTMTMMMTKMMTMMMMMIYI